MFSFFLLLFCLVSCQGQPGARPIVSFVAVAGVADAAVDESRRIDLKLLYRTRQERIGTRRRTVSRSSGV